MAFRLHALQSPSEGEAVSDAHRAHDVVATNLVGLVDVLVPLGEALREQRHGTLVVLSSVASLRARKSNYLYGASKAGLDAFADVAWAHPPCASSRRSCSWPTPDLAAPATLRPLACPHTDALPGPARCDLGRAGAAVGIALTLRRPACRAGSGRTGARWIGTVGWATSPDPQHHSQPWPASPGPAPKAKAVPGIRVIQGLSRTRTSVAWARMPVPGVAAYDNGYRDSRPKGPDGLG